MIAHLGLFRAFGPFRDRAERAQLRLPGILTDPSTPMLARELYIRRALHAVMCPDCGRHWTMDAVIGWKRQPFVPCGCAQ